MNDLEKKLQGVLMRTGFQGPFIYLGACYNHEDNHEGAVFSATRKETQEPVIAKIVPGDISERDAIGYINHPTIPFHFKEQRVLIDGKAHTIIARKGDPEQLLQDTQTIPLDDLVHIGIQLANGAKAMHKEGWCFVDYSPTNIKVSTDLKTAQYVEFGSATRKGDIPAVTNTFTPHWPFFASETTDAYTLGRLLENIAQQQRYSTQRPFIDIRRALNEWDKTPGALTMDALIDVLTAPEREEQERLLSRRKFIAHSIRVGAASLATIYGAKLALDAIHIHTHSSTTLLKKSTQGDTLIITEELQKKLSNALSSKIAEELRQGVFDKDILSDKGTIPNTIPVLRHTNAQNATHSRTHPLGDAQLELLCHAAKEHPSVRNTVVAYANAQAHWYNKEPFLLGSDTKLRVSGLFEAYKLTRNPLFLQLVLQSGYEIVRTARNVGGYTLVTAFRDNASAIGPWMWANDASTVETLLLADQAKHLLKQNSASLTVAKEIMNQDYGAVAIEVCDTLKTLVHKGRVYGLVEFTTGKPSAGYPVRAHDHPLVARALYLAANYAGSEQLAEEARTLLLPFLSDVPSGMSEDRFLPRYFMIDGPPGVKANDSPPSVRAGVRAYRLAREMNLSQESYEGILRGILLGVSWKDTTGKIENVRWGGLPEESIAWSGIRIKQKINQPSLVEGSCLAVDALYCPVSNPLDDLDLLMGLQY